MAEPETPTRPDDVRPPFDGPVDTAMKVVFMKPVARIDARPEAPELPIPEALRSSWHAIDDLERRLAFFSEAVATQREQSFALLPKFLWEVDKVASEDLLPVTAPDHRLFFNEEQKRIAILELFLARALGERGQAAAAWEQYLVEWASAMPDWRYTQVLLGQHHVATHDYVKAVVAFRVAFSQASLSPLIEQLYRQAVVLAMQVTPAPDITLSNIERAFLHDLSQRFCEKPFSNFEVWNTGEVFVCCGQWVPAPIGNVFTQNAEEIWNSPVAQDIRQSIHDGSYKYCSRTCPSIMKHSLWNRDELAVAARQAELGRAAGQPPEKAPQLPVEVFIQHRLAEESRTQLDSGPLFVNMAHDATCNLSCPSCRSEVRAADSETRKRLDVVRERVFDSVVPGTLLLKIAGDGDPFASKHYREILASLDVERMPRLRLVLLTNGVLLTPAEWTRFANIIPVLQAVEVSIDAASAETYRIVRRGGDWDKLLENLAHMSTMSVSGQIPLLQLNFVVQQLNFRDMKAFVELGLRFNARKIEFAAVHNGLKAFQPEAFRQANIYDPQHPEHAEFKALLADPIFSRPEVGLPRP